MRTIAAHTLGCKVNQYDTQAMLELFLKEGYTVVPMDQPADVYLINTCTVTGTGSRKSLQLIRKIHRERPESKLIVCGCLAQLQGEQLLSDGADLVLGTQRRGEVVSLLNRVAETGIPLCAVSPAAGMLQYENLTVSSLENHIRAVLKIQEGCSNHCTYCIIPAVRGPIRSRPPEDVLEEVSRLAAAGYCEIVLTGIHLSSYGRDLAASVSLTDVIHRIQAVPGVLRIRLGSLEPGIATEAFASELKKADKVCPQFHLALQSGSNTVLARMKRQYNVSQYLRGVENLRREYPSAAITTDVLTGFPGETEQEYRETRALIEQVGFSRIHVFPYSSRPGTVAAGLPGQLPAEVKDRRARELIALGSAVADRYLRSWVGRESVLLPEEEISGCWEGYTPEYVRVRLDRGAVCASGVPVRVRLVSVESRVMRGIIL